MDRERLIEKIGKLLEHSTANGATEAEAVAFALKAQRLMAENGIEEWELGDGDVSEIVELEVNPGVRRAWRKILHVVIAENFRCRAVLNVHRRARSSEHVPCFIGRREDAEAAALVFENLLAVGDRLGREHEDDHYTDPDAYENFVRGFTDGVRLELERQSQALMLTTTTEVDEHMRGMSLGKARAPRRVGYSEESRAAGRSAGRDAVRSRMIGGMAGLPAE